MCKLFIVGGKGAAKASRAGPSPHQTPSGMPQSSPAMDSPTEMRRRPPLHNMQDPPQGTKVHVDPYTSPNNNYNQGYKDQSLDAHRDTLAYANVNPAYDGHRDATNPAYKDRSPTHRPNLPYPGQHYNVFPPQNSNQRM